MAGEPVLHSLAISQVMLYFAAEHGVGSETCLAGTGISRAMLEDPDALITPDQELRLIENLMVALSGVPALGFALGLQYNVATFGTWGFALRTSRNLREALERATRYIPLSTAYCEFSTATHDDALVITANPDAIPVHCRRFLLERDLGTAVNLIRELNLTGQTIESLEFSGPPPDHAEQIRALCSFPVHFRCSQNRLFVNLADANRPLPTYDEHLVRLLEDQCRQLLARRQISGTAGKVRQRLLGALGLMASLEDVASDLHLSPRSLRRKLSAEDTSYRAIVEEARQQLACQLLAATDMTLDEMGLQLGYGDTASFTRAFRRWYGISPGEYRRRESA